jgi:hypothetical protein
LSTGYDESNDKWKIFFTSRLSKKVVLNTPYVHALESNKSPACIIVTKKAPPEAGFDLDASHFIAALAIGLGKV